MPTTTAWWDGRFSSLPGCVWHVDDQCPQLSRSAVLERHARQACSSYYITPYRYNDNNSTLHQDLNNYLAQLEDLSDEERCNPDPIEAVPDVVSSQ